MDMTGKVIYEKLSHSGETETIQAVPPVNIVVGNASDTKLNFSGQEVDLAAKTKINVARVTLE
jgi:cytoskeleton protein RodZ